MPRLARIVASWFSRHMTQLQRPLLPRKPARKAHAWDGIGMVSPISISMTRSIMVALILMSCSSSGSLLWAQGTEAAGFEEALESARSYPIQWHTPGDFEHAVALFEQVIADFPEHPRIAEAQYGLFEVLAMSDGEEELARAHGIINEVIQNTNAATPLGCSARLSMVAFQVNKARHHGFEDLPAAWAALSELEKVWGQKSVERANIVKHQAMLLRREGRNEEALAALISYYRETYTWPEEFWAQMKNDAPEQYRAFRRAFMLLNNQAVQAIAACNGPEASRLLRSAPLGFIAHPRVAAAWKEYEEKYILGEGETFETIQEQVYRDALSKKDLDSMGPESPDKAPDPSAPQSKDSRSVGPGATPSAVDVAQGDTGNTVSIGRVLVVGAVLVLAVGLVGYWAIRRRSSRRKSV